MKDLDTLAYEAFSEEGETREEWDARCDEMGVSYGGL